ncbi:RpiR family transcriptional regulator [Frondihabitans sucicola]|uniref:RpiR family transcriptional regulator n=1 Tax=Frondihabitans sucicola TaxID=1268041 RepID=A0ABN6Y3M1_9MICO|nr:DoxX family protein [Frondihabitans sucicola]BDZ50333.1 RpiR family transcriptional regulator [Frondihabitans sucicola]
MSLGTTLLRVTVGGLLAGHGLQKLTGSFNGPGIEGVTQMMHGIGLQPAKRNALLAAATETAGGAGVALGALTPLAAAGLIGSMVTAVRTVHLKNGPWNSDGGYEYNAVLIAALGVIAAGPGKLSFDAVIGRKSWGVGGTLFALIGGFAASAAVIELGRRAPAPEVDAEGAAG